MDHVRRQLTIAAALGAAVVGGLAGCGEGRTTPHAQAALVVDSAVPRDVALARFRTRLPAVTRLGGGAPSRDALVAAFVTALEHADTAALARLLLSRAEFAWLYYPTNPMGLPPYDLSPGLLWDMLTLGSGKGVRRALADFSGRSLDYRGYTCDAAASEQGANTIFGPCAVTLGTGTDTAGVRLFGLIIERAGRYKFVSYANQL